MTKVKIVKENNQYKVGDIITVSEEHANEMVIHGTAEIVKENVINSIEDSIIQISDKRTLIKQFLKRNPIFYDRTKMWWAWDNELHCWVQIDEVDIINILNKHVSLNTINSKERSEILEGLKQEGRLLVPQEIPKHWVQFNDKMFDIYEKKIIKPSPKYFVTNPIPWDFSSSSETPTIDKIFKEWVGEDYVQTLYEIMAYCLIPSYPIHRLFCFIGEGMNGKSKYLELISKFVGNNNITTTELDTLIDSRFEITRLHKKLVCLVGETNFNEMKKTSLLKKLSGGDLIGFEYKGKSPFEDYNYAKILISTNNLPSTTDKTIGFYRRWLIIDFPNRFSEKKDILDTIPEQEMKNLTRKCMDTLRMLLLKKEFHNEGTVEERMDKFEDKSNPFEKFLKDKTEEDLDSHIPKHEFRDILEDWCRENKFRILNERVVGKKMKDRGYETIKVLADWTTNEGTRPQIRAYGGLKWKKSDQKMPNADQKMPKSRHSRQSIHVSSTQNPHGKSSGNYLPCVPRVPKHDFIVGKEEFEVCEKCGLFHKKSLNCDKKVKNE